MVAFQERKNIVTKMNIKEKIIADCSKDISKEICGFIIKTRKGFDIKVMDNKAVHPDKEFYIPAKDFLYVKRIYNIVGIYHSHIIGDDKPSEYDLKTSDLICYPFVIYSVKNNTIHFHKPEELDADLKLVEQLESELK